MKFTKILLMGVFGVCLSSGVYAERDSVGFHTKNGSVGCRGMGREGKYEPFVGCTLKATLMISHHYKRKNCGTEGGVNWEWGSSFSVAKTGKASIECMSDTYYNVDGMTLKVGQTVKGDGWSCTGIPHDGVKCLNSQKKGFIMQRDRQVLLN